MQDYYNVHPSPNSSKDRIILSKKDIFFNFFTTPDYLKDHLKPLVDDGLIKISETSNMMIIDLK